MDFKETKAVKQSSYKKLEQGDIIKVDLSPTIGTEQADYRPCMVTTHNEYNRKMGGIVGIAPISNTKDFPTHFDVDTEGTTTGKILVEHFRTLDVNVREYIYVDKASDEMINKWRKIFMTFF